jgi:hypothetical protein
MKRAVTILGTSILFASGAASADTIYGWDFTDTTNPSISGVGTFSVSDTNGLIDAATGTINGSAVGLLPVGTTVGSLTSDNVENASGIPGYLSGNGVTLQADTAYNISFNNGGYFLTYNNGTSVVTDTIAFSDPLFDTGWNGQQYENCWYESDGDGHWKEWDGNRWNDCNPPPCATPEPSTYALLACGLGMLGWMGRRRAKNAVA